MIKWVVIMTKKMKVRIRKVLKERDGVNPELSAMWLTYVTTRFRKVGLGSGARKAMEKSCL